MCHYCRLLSVLLGILLVSPIVFGVGYSVGIKRSKSTIPTQTVIPHGIKPPGAMEAPEPPPVPDAPLIPPAAPDTYCSGSIDP